jgi:hypothetical protein
MAGQPMWQLETDEVHPGKPGIFDYWFTWVRPLDNGQYAGLPTNAARMPLNEQGVARPTPQTIGWQSVLRPPTLFS